MILSGHRGKGGGEESEWKPVQTTWQFPSGKDDTQRLDFTVV